MEDKLQQALDFANYRQTLNNQLHKARITAESMLLIAEAGGKFTINQQLICFIDFLQRNGHVNATLLDDNGSPVNILDINEFLKKITDRYFEVTNDYFQESQAIKKARNIKTLLDIKE